MIILFMLVLIVFFCFKQKTAYEMRISDWSSDVCSSDLNGEFFETDLTLTAEAPLDDAVIAVTPALWHDMTVNTMIPAPAEESFKDGYFHFSYGPLDAGERLHVKKIGRASCRERVCQYV